MNLHRRPWIILCTACFCGFLANFAAAGTPATRLEGRVRSGITQIKATFEAKGSRRKFSTELTRAAANTTFTIVATRSAQPVGQWTITTNGLGFADLNRDTSNGQAVPAMSVGDVVEIRTGNQVLRTVLQSR